MNKGNQGIFHLLTILLIPIILAVFFLAESIIFGILLSIAYVVLIIWLLKQGNKN